MLIQTRGHNPVDKDGISGRVRKVRKLAGLTQGAFAGRIAYSKVQVLSVEKGKVIPSRQFLEKVASEFGVSSEWLFTGVGSMKAVEYRVDDRLISWLNAHPEVVRKLRIRRGLD